MANSPRFRFGERGDQAMRMERGSPLHEELRLMLLERRQRAKLTQRQLAAKLGWDQTTISKIESGGKRVSVVELIELAKALDFDPAAAVKRVARRAVNEPPE